jgi:uncharacterized iron-regulated membrane protein
MAILVDDASGRARPARAGGEDGPPPRSAIAAWSRRIHDGTELGLLWQTIIVLGGVAPTVLGLTGAVMWLTRRGRRRALAQAG